MAVSATLLVVENEAAVKALVQVALERHGYVVLAIPVDFIQKPFSPSALAANVRVMLDRCVAPE